MPRKSTLTTLREKGNHTVIFEYGYLASKQNWRRMRKFYKILAYNRRNFHLKSILSSA